MLSIEKGEYYYFNEVATEIWKYLENPTRAEDVLNELISNYIVSPETCENETIDFLKELLEVGVIEIANE